MKRKINFAMMDKRTKMIIAASIIGITVISVSLVGIAMINVPSPPEGSSLPPFFIEPDNLYYSENLNLYLMKSGDILYDYDLMDQGHNLLDFPIELDAPANFTYEGILDASVILEVSEINPLVPETGPIFSDVSIGEGLFSHIKVTIEIDLTYYNETDDGQIIVDNIMGNLTSYFSTEFFKVSNNTGLSPWRNTYLGYPSDFAAIWAKLPDDTLTLNHSLTSLNLGKIRNSPYKQLRIEANWDENTASAGIDLRDRDERWEYDTEFNFIAENAISILENAESTIKFTDIFSYSDVLEVPDYIDICNFNIYTYQGAEILDIEPFDNAEDNEYGRINLDLIDNHENNLTDQAFFKIKDSKLNEPCVKIRQYANTTIVSPGDKIKLTYNISNIGPITVYNIEVLSDFFGSARYDNVSGELVPVIASLASGSSIIREIILNATSTTGAGSYDIDVDYDAISDPTADITWRSTSLGGADYSTDGNNLYMRNGVNPDNTPFLITDIEYDTAVDVGEEVIYYVKITNIDKYNASNVVWRIADSNIGYNSTPVEGVIDEIKAGETIYFNFTLQIDTTNRFLGEYRENVNSFYLRWYNGTGEGALFTDNFEINMNIFPVIDHVFGPLIIITPTYSASSILKGDIVTLSINIKNIGDRIAEVLSITTIYENDAFTHYAGQGSLTYGPLAPGEEFTMILRVKLLRDFLNLHSIQFPIQATHYTGIDWYYDIDITSYQNLYSNMDITPTFILGVALIAACVFIVGENIFMLVRKVRNPV